MKIMYQLVYANRPQEPKELSLGHFSSLGSSRIRAKGKGAAAEDNDGRAWDLAERLLPTSQRSPGQRKAETGGQRTRSLSPDQLTDACDKWHA